MKKKGIVSLLLLILYLCTGCDLLDKLDEMDYEENPEKINVIVSGVDDGILHCKYVCEWEDSYAYYHQGVIYYYDTANSEPYEIECAGLEYMDMNDGYIYYTKGTGMMVFDKKSKQTTEISEMGEVWGISVFEDEVIVLCRYDYCDEIHYEMDGSMIKNETIVESPNIFLSSTNKCANHYCHRYTYVHTNKKMYRIQGEGARIIDEHGNEGDFFEFDGRNMGPATSPEHICEYNGNIYILHQASYGSNVINVKYDSKAWDQIICFDPSTDTSSSIYKTSGREEQIVSFSVENDELYLLIEGKLYKSTLTGENKTELTDLSGIAQTLSFDYGNDTLFVYDGEKLIGQYK